ncbi:MAG: hypothetical protein JST40_03980 [Armatimonadetes bacterium]|nr:hypothetical protein [Armatimonadota bacterium]
MGLEKGLTISTAIVIGLSAGIYGLKSQTPGQTVIPDKLIKKVLTVPSRENNKARCLWEHNGKTFAIVHDKQSYSTQIDYYDLTGKLLKSEKLEPFIGRVTAFDKDRLLFNQRHLRGYFPRRYMLLDFENHFDLRSREHPSELLGRFPVDGTPQPNPDGSLSWFKAKDGNYFYFDADGASRLATRDELSVLGTPGNSHRRGPHDGGFPSLLWKTPPEPVSIWQRTPWLEIWREFTGTNVYGGGPGTRKRFLMSVSPDDGFLPARNNAFFVAHRRTMGSQQPRKPSQATLYQYNPARGSVVETLLCYGDVLRAAFCPDPNVLGVSAECPDAVYVWIGEDQ